MIRDFIRGMGQAVIELGDFSSWALWNLVQFVTEVGPFLVVVLFALFFVVAALEIAIVAGEWSARALFGG